MKNSFEERYNTTFVDGRLFKELYKDNEITGKYYVTLDYNIIDTFYAENDRKAKEVMLAKYCK